MQHEYNERNARALFKLLRERTDALDVLVNGPVINGEQRPSTLQKMLESGKYPPTQIAGLQRAFDAFCGALDDLEMEMLLPLEMARNEAEDALARARALGVQM